MRRKKKRKKQNPVDELIKLSVVGIGLLVFMKTNDFTSSVIGSLVTLILIVTWRFLKSSAYSAKLRKSNIYEIDSMDGVQFEHFLKELFKSKGYRVELTAATGDFGADLILNKDGKRCVVQVKRYSKPVGIKAVQEVIPSLKMYKGTEAWVITNNGFTKSAIALAKTNDVVLIGREQLMDLITSSSPTDSPTPNPLEIKKEIRQDTKKLCDKCGSNMIIRNGPKGIFHGCSNFPQCRNTLEAV